MPIQSKIPIAQVTKHLEEAIEQKRAQIVTALQWLGEKCINEARTAGDYTDRTGNLRSSIGYAILYNGEMIIPPTGFAEVHGGTPAKVEEKKGSEAGRDTLDKLIQDAPSQGFVLIVVAGMHYAQYVSAMGYNVLDSAEVLAKTELPHLLDKLRVKWRKK